MAETEGFATFRNVITNALSPKMIPDASSSLTETRQNNEDLHVSDDKGQPQMKHHKEKPHIQEMRKRSRKAEEKDEVLVAL